MVNWYSLFHLSVPLAETLVRGTVFYWFLFILFRVVIRRDAGAVGLADVLVIVIIADAGQNAMAGEYTSITDGMILVSTIVFWNQFIDWLAYRFKWIRRLAQPSVLVLVRNGQVLKRNLRQEALTEEDLMSLIRQEGVESLDAVKNVFMEPDGSVSVIKRKQN